MRPCSEEDYTSLLRPHQATSARYGQHCSVLADSNYHSREREAHYPDCVVIFFPVVLIMLNNLPSLPVSKQLCPPCYLLLLHSVSPSSAPLHFVPVWLNYADDCTPLHPPSPPPFLPFLNLPLSLCQTRLHCYFKQLWQRDGTAEADWVGFFCMDRFSVVFIS